MEDVVMRTFDFTPFSRSSIGFDHLFDLLNNPQLTEEQGGYPPYDIVRTGPDTYRIAVAIAGFTPDEITVTSQQNLLTVEGRKANEDDQQYLHRSGRYKRYRLRCKPTGWPVGISRSYALSTSNMRTDAM